jgi:hypothetical protein
MMESTYHQRHMYFLFLRSISEEILMNIQRDSNYLFLCVVRAVEDMKPNMETYCSLCYTIIGGSSSAFIPQ